MKELIILLAPVFWSIKNNITRIDRSFYKKTIFYIVSCVVFIFVTTELLTSGMNRLQNLSSEIFTILLVKGYSLIFVIIFFIQIINGFIISLTTFYQSEELEMLFTSPVNRVSLFFSRLFETHLKASWMLIIFGIPLLISSGLLYHANPFYYVYSLLLFVAFSVISVNIGIGISIFLSSFFHIRRLKKILFTTGIVTAVLLVTLLRIFKPERFINPELFANLTLFISELKTPSFILLPNRWLSESIFDFLSRTFNIDMLIFISLLFLTSYVTTVFLQTVFKRYHYRGWSLMQEGSAIFRWKRQQISYPGAVIKKAISKPVQSLLSVLDTQSRTLIRKDLVYQIRDVKNIHQILILFSLVIIYLFSIASLPLNWEYYAVQLKYIISFFNLGLILLIITSLCSRLVCPAISSEGNYLWIIKTSPTTPKRYIWTKFFFFFIPVFLFGQLLTVSSSLFINIEKPLLLLEIMTTTLLSLSFVSLAIMFSVSDLRHSINDSAKEQMKSGSPVYMVISFLLILFTLTLEIVPIFLYFLKEAATIEFTDKTWFMIGAVIFILFLVNLVITAISLRLGIKRFDKVVIG